ncbi:bifunctional 3-dehydroquinate dehydratase/shikimate dehydrogenase, chloroplastic-like [Chenopodium quinoa]|uniref:bifunctional 3-dehydroquinate dehydratase/shikimate dehydrogenase, chloroplastic-like n=1 Tax=Chenopodium quinoa TaxID=63459 RepID=UPI000B7873E9|nr:bifunctional 3-dehydroquinate dehydratase/shikimate dehydrogenase, chloroplastic-like [Chenopodium quinoa]
MILTSGYWNLETPLEVGVGENVRRNSTLICTSILAKTVDEMLVQVREAKKQGVDLVELRLDCLNNFNLHHDLEALLKHTCLPTIVTFRGKGRESAGEENCGSESNGEVDQHGNWEGGQYDGDEGMRQSALHIAMELGADYIDVEYKVADEFFKSIDDDEKELTKTTVIVSSHNFVNTPSLDELGGLLASIQAVGADIVNIATTAVDITDNARIMQLLTYSQVPMIGVVMGEKGLMSRILSAKFGGFLTYATLECRESVPGLGQSTIKDLLDLYTFRQIGADTKVLGVLGNPISHSKSPHLYNAAFKSVGFNGVYLPLLVDSVSDFLETYSSPDFVGYKYIYWTIKGLFDGSF